MSQNPISLTDAEWQVMECLWAAAPQSGRQLTQTLADRMGWSRSTTLTLLRRLEDKAAVGSRDENGKKAFFPQLLREDAALAQTQSLLQRVYKGSVSMLVSSLTQKQDLPQEEIDELYAILQKAEENGRK